MEHETKARLDINGESGELEHKRFSFRLYVSKENHTAEQAIKNLAKICKYLGLGECDVEIIDVYAQPSRAEVDRVIAIPTLIKSNPLPVIRIIGDLRDSKKVLESFGFQQSEII